jgi:CDP-diacylglycerol--glycerol-3-phosphate 3-phosphatidyltransferase
VIAIPLGLTLIRLLLGPAAVALAFWKVDRLIFLPVLAVGLYTDILDGIMARRLDVSYAWLRRLDSFVDLAFYLCALAATVIVAPDTATRAIVPFAILLTSEAACVGVSLARFGLMPATHCYSAKVYALALFATFAAVLAFDAGPAVVWALAVFGLAANTEVLAILILSATPPVDVASVYRVIRCAPNPEGKDG